MPENHVVNPKDFFEYCQGFDFDIERLEKQIEKVKRLLEVQGVSYDEKVSTGSSANRLVDDLVALLDYMEELRDLQHAYIDQQRKMEYVIRHIRNPWQRQAVSLRYVHNLSLDNVAEQMGYSKSGVRHLLDKCFYDMNDWLPRVLQKYSSN